MTFIVVLLSFGVLASLIGILVPFRPFRNRKQALGAFLGLLFLQGVVSATFSKSSTAPLKATMENVSVSERKGLTETKAPDLTPELHSNWNYSSSKDEMTEQLSSWYCAESTNTVEFDFPYSGGSSAELCLRRKGKKLDSYIKVSKGQFLCSIEGCTVQVKVDEKPISSYSAGESDSGRSDMLFIESASRLQTALSASKQLKLQANFYQAGRRTFTFDTAGYEKAKFN